MNLYPEYCWGDNSWEQEEFPEFSKNFDTIKEAVDYFTKNALSKDFRLLGVWNQDGDCVWDEEMEMSNPHYFTI